MNAYARRCALREAKAELRKRTLQYERAVHVDAIMRRYEEAHNLVMGYYPEIGYRGGRFHVVGQYIRSFREKQLIHETDKLYAILNEQTLMQSAV